MRARSAASQRRAASAAHARGRPCHLGSEAVLWAARGRLALVVAPAAPLLDRARVERRVGREALARRHMRHRRRNGCGGRRRRRRCRRRPCCCGAAVDVGTATGYVDARRGRRLVRVRVRVRVRVGVGVRVRVRVRSWMPSMPQWCRCSFFQVE